MKSSHWGRQIWLLVVVSLMGAALAACTPDASASIISPALGEQLAAAEAGAEIVIQPTPELLKYADLTEEQVYAGMPADLAAAVAGADPAGGQTLALSSGCVGCHALDPNQQMTGPTWYNMGDTAANRVPGQGPAEYLHQSIVATNSYIVPGYPANIMPQIYNTTLSQDDLATLIAYLLSLHGQ